MKKEILKKQKQLSKEGYVVVPNYFLREWVKVLGVGPAMLYLYLLTYCHKGKDIVWPTISTLCKKMNLTPKTITKYLQALLKYVLIKKVSKKKTSLGCHTRNIYQITLFDMGKNTLPLSNIFSYLEGKITPGIGEKLPTNNTNLNITKATATNGEKDAAVVAVNFNKLKEEGEEKMLAVREQLRDLDFKEEFMEKILKEYSVKKIEENLDLLMERKNIQNPAGWLSAALKNDYRGEGREPCPKPHPHLNPPPSKGEETRRMDSRFRGNDIKESGNEIWRCGNDKCRGVLQYAPPQNIITSSDLSEHGNLNSPLPSPLAGEGKDEDDRILSTEEVRERFHLLREKLMAMS